MIDKHDPMSYMRSAPKHKIVSAEQDKINKTNRFAESDLQTKICKWLRESYPGLIFFSDFAAGMYIPNETVRQVRSNQSCEGKYLDLTILKPVGPHYGLVIEIKVKEDDLFLVDGITLKNDHVRDQYDMIVKLRGLGYASDFGVGELAIKAMVTDYMNNHYCNRSIVYSRK